jgi:hypothetical protein
MRMECLNLACNAEIDMRHNIIQELSLILLDKLSTDTQSEFQAFPKRDELAAIACGIHSASNDLDEGLYHRYNAIHKLSQILLDRLWTDSQCEFQQFPKRFELAALAGGIHSEMNEIYDLLARSPKADEPDMVVAGEVANARP